MSADEVVASNKSMADAIIVNLECEFGVQAAWPVTQHLLAAREAMAALRDREQMAMEREAR